jgi:hypothetical protein
MKSTKSHLFALIILIGQFTSQAIAISKTVGTASADYATLKLAFDAVNAGTITGAVDLQIIDNTTEPSASGAILYQSGYTGAGGLSNYTSIKIYPTVTNKTITGAVSGALITLNGATNVTFDGRLHDASGALTGSVKDLAITNSMVAGGSMTIQLKTNASDNAVKYCKIKGAGNSNTLAIITFSNPTTASATGCANNTISNNTFSGVDANRPWTVVFSQGIAGALNTGNKILDNDIENCFVTASGGACISIHTFNNAFTISGNSFYETATFTDAVAATAINLIYIGSGNSHVISNNYIGGTQTKCGGGLFTKTSDANNTFKGIYYYSNDAGAASTIENNVFKNIAYSNGTTTAPWTAISVEGTHAVDIIGNTIANISVTNNAVGNDVVGIFKSNGTTNQLISKNFICGLTSSAASSGQLWGIKLTGGISTVSNNIIALTTDNAVSIIGIYDNGSAGKTTQLYFNTIRLGGASTTGAKGSYALWSQSLLNTRDFRNNIFANARSNSGGTGSHYAVYLNYAENTNLTIDNNDYYVVGIGGVLGKYNNANVTTGSVMVTGKDASSVSLNPVFANATGATSADFKPTVTTLIGGAGTGITTDYLGTTRIIPTIGAWEYSNTTNAAPTINATHNIRVYPTLCSDKLNVSAGSEISRIVIRNLVGQTIKSTTVNNTKTTLDMRQLPAGNFCITVVLANGDVSTQKIVKF